jgi:hypothetical protein
VLRHEALRDVVEIELEGTNERLGRAAALTGIGLSELLQRLRQTTRCVGAGTLKVAISWSVANKGKCNTLTFRWREE